MQIEIVFEHKKTTLYNFQTSYAKCIFNMHLRNKVLHNFSFHLLNIFFRIDYQLLFKKLKLLIMKQKRTIINYV